MTAVAEPRPFDPPATGTHRVAEAVSKTREIAIAVVILLVFGLTTIKNPGFAHASSIQEVLTGAALIGLLSVGETVVVVTRNVDLSVGSTLGLSAFELGEIFTHHPHTNILLAFAIAIGIGLACGVVIGLITTVAKVPSLVVTLAALYIIRGYINLVGSGTQIESSVIPSTFQKVGYETILGVPWLFVIVAVVVLVAAYCMRTFRACRDLYAIGSNPDAAALAGIPIARRVFAAFALSGALAGLGGALFLAEFAQVDATGGTGYELLVVAAVVVGGVAIFGGSGSVIGALLGAVLLQVINQALVAVRVSSFWDQALAGALLLIAIAFDRFIGLRASRAVRTKGGVSHVL